MKKKISRGLSKNIVLIGLFALTMSPAMPLAAQEAQTRKQRAIARLQKYMGQTNAKIKKLIRCLKGDEDTCTKEDIRKARIYTGVIGTTLAIILGTGGAAAYRYLKNKQEKKERSQSDFPLHPPSDKKQTETSTSEELSQTEETTFLAPHVKYGNPELFNRFIVEYAKQNRLQNVNWDYKGENKLTMREFAKKHMNWKSFDTETREALEGLGFSEQDIEAPPEEQPLPAPEELAKKQLETQRRKQEEQAMAKILHDYTDALKMNLSPGAENFAMIELMISQRSNDPEVFKNIYWSEIRDSIYQNWDKLTRKTREILLDEKFKHRVFTNEQITKIETVQRQTHQKTKRGQLLREKEQRLQKEQQKREGEQALKRQREEQAHQEEEAQQLEQARQREEQERKKSEEQVAAQEQPPQEQEEEEEQQGWWDWAFGERKKSEEQATAQGQPPQEQQPEEEQQGWWDWAFGN